MRKETITKINGMISKKSSGVIVEDDAVISVKYLTGANAKRRALYADRIKKKLCVRCGKKALKNSTLCAKHKKQYRK